MRSLYKNDGSEIFDYKEINQEVFIFIKIFIVIKSLRLRMWI